MYILSVWPGVISYELGVRSYSPCLFCLHCFPDPRLVREVEPHTSPLSPLTNPQVSFLQDNEF